MARKTQIIKPSPYPLTFTPRDLKREIVTDRQTNISENTIKYGPDDALPLRIIKAVDSSPAATQCIDEIKRFIQGASFTDESLMDLIVDPDGTTLWDLHSQICDYMAVLDGFSVNFKFNLEKKITAVYSIGLENCRFVRPETERSKEIRTIRYNPYFGTNEFKEDFSTDYQAFDLEAVTTGIKNEGTNYPGQIYYYGKERPLYKFYPVPKYWTAGENAIYADAAVYEYHKNNLDNSFLLSTLMNIIGDPNAQSQNPKYRKTKTDSNGNTVDDGSTHTVGQEFSEMMAENFSGVKKAGSVMALWSLNQDEAAKIQSFPSSTNFDTIEGTLNSVIRGIAIATGVQAILANLPQQASSLGSDGNSMKAAVELMLSRVSARQRTLELFYNNVLLPNLAQPTEAKVKIKNYMPISTQVTVEDKFWEFMDDQEKVDFINENVPNVNVKPRIVVTAPVEPLAPEPTHQDQILKGLGLRDIDKIGKIKARLESGKVTHDQAVMILKGFGFSDEQVNTFLQLNGEEV